MALHPPPPTEPSTHGSAEPVLLQRSRKSIRCPPTGTREAAMTRLSRKHH